jgi:ketosteroid isomerase-like protein
MRPREAMREIFAAWESNDPDGLARLFTEDGIYEDPLKPARLVGKADVREGNAPAMAALDSCRIDIARIVEDGDTGFCEGFFASSLADGSGRLDFPFAMIVEMRDGLVARCGEYFDTRPLLPRDP